MLRQPSIRRAAVLCLALGGMATTAHAQLGSGWVSTTGTFTRKIHLDDDTQMQIFDWTSYKSVCSPICADYRYDSATDTETFRLLDGRTNRSEIRLFNEYSTGRKQFEGYVTFGSPLDDESLMQIFGSTSGATQMMLRGYSSDGGSLRAGSTTVASGVYGLEQRVNVIHEQGSAIRIYINGSQKATVSDTENVTNYWKYGCYGTLNTGAVSVKWRRVRLFTDGYAPSGTSPTATPTPTPTRTPTPAPPASSLVFQAEALAIDGSSGDSVTVLYESGLSGGAASMISSNAVGDFVTYRTPTVAAGSYTVSIGIKRYTSRAIVQTQIGSDVYAPGNLGSPLDHYGTSSYAELNVGTWSPGSTTEKLLKFQVTGHNASSTGYTMCIDYIKLTPQ